MKKWWWFPFVWMVDVVIQGAWVLYRINKDKDDESLPLLAFRRYVVNVIFLKYSKEGRLSSSHLGIRNMPSDVCRDDTKHYLVQSEHRRLQKPFKHLKGSAFTLTVNSLKSLTGYAKTLHLRCLKGSKYASAEGRCKVCKKNSRRRCVKFKSTWHVFWNSSKILANVWPRNVRFENLWISSV